MGITHENLDANPVNIFTGSQLHHSITSSARASKSADSFGIRPDISRPGDGHQP